MNYYKNDNHINLNQNEINQYHYDQINDEDHSNNFQNMEYLNGMNGNKDPPHVKNVKVLEVLNNLDNYKYLESQTSSEECKLTTKGPLELPDKSIYEGEWSSQNQRHGKGK